MPAPSIDEYQDSCKSPGEHPDELGPARLIQDHRFEARRWVADPSGQGNSKGAMSMCHVPCAVHDSSARSDGQREVSLEVENRSFPGCCGVLGALAIYAHDTGPSTFPQITKIELPNPAFPTRPYPLASGGSCSAGPGTFLRPPPLPTPTHALFSAPSSTPTRVYRGC